MIKTLCEYVGIKYKNGADVRVSIDKLHITDIIIPQELITPRALEKRVWENDVDNGVKRRSIFCRFIPRGTNLF